MNKSGKGQFKAKFNKEQINEIISQYQKCIPITSIAINFDCCRGCIVNNLIKNNVYISNHVSHSVDYSFFESIDCESKAYWLGMLAADGCVQITKKGKRFSLSLKSSDRDHLIKFQKAINASHPIYDHFNMATNKKHPVSTISIWSKKMVEDLEKLGLTPRKSLTLEFTKIKSDLERHFIRGYFDGDGSWYLQKQKYPAFSLIGSTKFIETTQLILVKSCLLPMNKLFKTNTEGLIRLKYTGGKQCRKLFHYLYDDATIFLPRKFEKITNAL